MCVAQHRVSDSESAHVAYCTLPGISFAEGAITRKNALPHFPYFLLFAVVLPGVEAAGARA